MTKTTKSNWFKAKRHDGVTLPSGTVVSIQLPNLSLMLKTGQIPNALVDAAVEMQNAATRGVEVTREMIEAQWDFYSYLVSKTVVEPALTPDEVEQIPAEDVDMLVEFATRQRDIDAVYKHIAGLDKMESFRKFRSLDGGIPGLETF